MAEPSYKKANARRAAELAKPGVVSVAEAETQVGVAQVADAQVATLAQQKSYEVLRAPFAGTVTARYADPGALVQAATGAQTGALPLVTISTPERLRVTSTCRSATPRSSRSATRDHDHARPGRVRSKGLCRADRASSIRARA